MTEKYFSLRLIRLREESEGRSLSDFFTIPKVLMKPVSNENLAVSEPGIPKGLPSLWRDG